MWAFVFGPVFLVAQIMYALIYLTDNRRESYVRNLVNTSRWDDRSRIFAGQWKFVTMPLPADMKGHVKVFAVLFKLSFLIGAAGLLISAAQVFVGAIPYLFSR